MNDAELWVQSQLVEFPASKVHQNIIDNLVIVSYQAICNIEIRNRLVRTNAHRIDVIDRLLNTGDTETDKWMKREIALYQIMGW